VFAGFIYEKQSSGLVSHQWTSGLILQSPWQKYGFNYIANLCLAEEGCIPGFQPVFYCLAS